MVEVIIKYLKLLKMDLFCDSFKFNTICMVANWFRGSSGNYLRTVLLSKFIGSVGDNVSFYGGVIIIHPEKLHIGNNVLFNKDIYIQASGEVKIDDFSIFGPSVKIWSLNHIFTEPDVWIPEQGYEYSPVKIGKFVWVGANVFIMPGAEIGDYCVISAGSVVGAKKFPAGSILAGNPARKIGNRRLPNISKE